MSFVINCFKGIFIGAGAILPGISSGVLCVIFGIYEKLLDSVLYFFTDFKKNSKFLLPLAIGGIIGILIFSNLLNYFLSNFPLQTKSIFIGLILGSIPSLIKEVNSKEPFKLKFVLFTVITFAFGLFTTYLGNYLQFDFSNNLNIFYLFFCGFIMSIGIIVPGVSSTIILMLLGVYSSYLLAISSLYFPILIPMGIGLLLGSLCCMKMTNFLLKHFYAPTFYSIIGFTLGSIFVLIPDISYILDLVLFILCISLGFFIFNIKKSGY